MTNEDVGRANRTSDVTPPHLLSSRLGRTWGGAPALNQFAGAITLPLLRYSSPRYSAIRAHFARPVLEIGTFPNPYEQTRCDF